MSADPFAPDDLSDLWSDAQRAERLHPQRPRMTAAKPALAKAIAPSVLYTDPQYWEPRRGIALIHEASRTLIGNFQEYVHTRSRGCRKLVRVDEPIAIHATEFIHGWEHLGAEERIRFEPQVATETREILLPDLILPALGVHATAVLVRVCLHYGGIIRVELTQHTQLVSPDGRMHLTLTAGLNVLECMSLDSKVALRKEMMV